MNALTPLLVCVLFMSPVATKKLVMGGGYSPIDMPPTSMCVCVQVTHAGWRWKSWCCAGDDLSQVITC